MFKKNFVEKKLDRVTLNSILEKKNKKVSEFKLNYEKTQKLKNKTLEKIFFLSYPKNKIFEKLPNYEKPENLIIKKEIRKKLINFQIKKFLRKNNFEIIFKSIQIIDLFLIKKKKIIYKKKNLKKI